MFHKTRFESFVNSERCKTAVDSEMDGIEFESFVNSERCKTNHSFLSYGRGLRALLIQKDVKHTTAMQNVNIV